MVPIGAGGVSKIAAGGAAAVAGGVAGGAVTGASGCGTVSAGGAVVSAGAVSCAKAGAAKPPRAVPSRSAEQSRRLLEIALIAVTRPRPLRLSPVIRPARLRIFENRPARSGPADPPPTLRPDIGRAPRRERVSQYVSISVGAGTSQHKN